MCAFTASTSTDNPYSWYPSLHPPIVHHSLNKCSPRHNVGRYPGPKPSSLDT
ncbi:hypothetical protein KC19_8G146400 [Ceratodon purpureus]|uniref:Uncharacterized protein n=1 Tax=Ceratodon purpureus TaxID=3225 RepID=A0A8T0H434_CERPU|nr:hypothetical protein KC19_8G146400 [Ceratodon purpureus]